MATASEAITNMETSEAELRERISALRSERRAETLARREAKTEIMRQRRLERLERMAGRLEHERHSAKVVTAGPAKRGGIDRKALWKSAIRKAQGDDAARASGETGGIDRKALWKKAIKGE